MTQRWFLGALLALCACASFAQRPAPTAPVDDSAFGLAKGSVFDTPTPTPYGFDGPGAGKLIAPPPGTPVMIPHAIDAYLPLAIERNACLGCHDRAGELGKKVAKGSARPAPASHYVLKDGKRIISGAQFTCTACHAPQSGVAPLVRNAASPLPR